MRRLTILALAALAAVSCMGGRCGEGQGLSYGDITRCDSCVIVSECLAESCIEVPDSLPVMLSSVLSFTLPDTDPFVPEIVTEAQEQMYKDLFALRQHHRALCPGQKTGKYQLLADQWVPDEVYAFTRTFRRDVVLVMTNMSGKYTSCALPDGVQWADAFTGEIWEGELVCPILDPWGFKILIRK